MAEKEQTTPIRLLSDYWRTEDDRVAAGEVIEVTMLEAMRLLEAQKAQRADPL